MGGRKVHFRLDFRALPNRRIPLRLQPARILTVNMLPDLRSNGGDEDLGHSNLP